MCSSRDLASDVSPERLRIWPTAPHERPGGFGRIWEQEVPLLGVNSLGRSTVFCPALGPAMTFLADDLRVLGAWTAPSCELGRHPLAGEAQCSVDPGRLRSWQDL